ncbi:MAG: HAD-IIIA family hydrolase [Chitinophagaceae bacterium]|nr:HAD-IIIA family hydrolase [Chitinophagaceae bacterium]
MDLLENVDKSWTLFLDRDGVINHEKKLDYILHRGEFLFYDGVKEAMKIFNEMFGKIIIVTNQRGIGKKMMTDEDLHDIHNFMIDEVTLSGGRIDSIYYCSSMDNDCYDRKPNPGMAYKAQKDFPNIDLNKSIIIGNNLSDMEFGRNAGMITLFVATTNPGVMLPDPLINYRFEDLYQAAVYLAKRV